MTLIGVPLPVIGVIAPTFDPDSVPTDGYYLSADLFIPAAQFPAPRGLHAAGPVMLGVARLKDGVSGNRASANLDAIRRRIEPSGAEPAAAGSASAFTA